MKRIYEDAEQTEDEEQDRIDSQNFDNAFSRMQASIERNFIGALRRIEAEYVASDWVRDFSAKKAHVQWRVKNREYPSPAEHER